HRAPRRAEYAAPRLRTRSPPPPRQTVQPRMDVLRVVRLSASVDLLIGGGGLAHEPLDTLGRRGFAIGDHEPMGYQPGCASTTPRWCRLTPCVPAPTTRANYASHVDVDDAGRVVRG